MSAGGGGGRGGGDQRAVPGGGGGVLERCGRSLYANEERGGVGSTLPLRVDRGNQRVWEPPHKGTGNKMR